MNDTRERNVYCIDPDCDGSGTAGAFDGDPDCPECGDIMTDAARASAVFGHETAVVVSKKANNDPTNMPGA